MEDDSIESLCRRSLSSDKAEIDSFISELQASGASLIQTMKILIDKLKISLNEAQELTLNSTAWNDHKESFYDFNRRIFDAWDNGADIVDEEEKNK